MHNPRFPSLLICSLPRRNSRLALLAPLVAALVMLGGASLHAQIIYLSSDLGQPWNSPDNTTAMNTVFGAGDWSSQYFQTASAGTLFAPTTQFIFADGSDQGANAMSTFLGANLTQLESWVSNGGDLFLNAAPNVGANINFGFGITLNYAPTGNAATYSGVATAVNPSSPIINGPFGDAGTNFTGTWFSHATVSGGNLSPLLTGTAGTILAQENYGSGHILVGGMTAPSFHNPSPQSTELLDNTLAYASGGQAAATPEPSTWALLLCGGAFLAWWQCRGARG